MPWLVQSIIVVHAQQCWSLIERPAIYCRDIFNRLDVDKSGGVSMEELSKGLVNMGYLVSEVRQACCTG